MKKLKISLIFNIIIVILVTFAIFAMFTGLKFMNGKEVVLEATKIEMFKFYTVLSNLFMGIISFIFSIKEVMLLKNKIKEIDKKYYILKLMGTTSVTLTLLVVFTYLGPITEYGLVSLLMNSNLLLHLVIPLLSIITFIFFEKNKKLNLKLSYYGLVPTLLYGIYYIINVFSHIENGKVSTIYDWYWFLQNGVWTAIIVIPLILLITYFISFILVILNRRG